MIFNLKSIESDPNKLAFGLHWFLHLMMISCDAFLTNNPTQWYLLVVSGVTDFFFPSLFPFTTLMTWQIKRGYTQTSTFFASLTHTLFASCFFYFNNWCSQFARKALPARVYFISTFCYDESIMTFKKQLIEKTTHWRSI